MDRLQPRRRRSSQVDDGAHPPGPQYPGDLGQRIYDNVSREAWQRWLSHQTMLINEYRLTPIEPDARKFLEQEMEKFFFGEGSARPQEFVPPSD